MNNMPFATAPWGVYPTDVTSPMPSQVRGPSGEKPDTDNSKKPPTPARPQGK